MRDGKSVVAEIRNEKIALVAGTALAAVAAGIGLYNVLKDDAVVAQDKAPVAPAKQEQPTVPPHTRGSVAEKGM